MSSNLHVYKKESNKIIKKVREGNVELSKAPVYDSSMRMFSTDLQSDRLLSPYNVSANKYKMSNRINLFNILRIKLALLKNTDCLEKKTYGDVNGYTIRNIINLEKRFGTKSKYGAIYLTRVPALANTFPIATKIMVYNTSNYTEVKLMSLITTNIILKGVSRHFLIIYGSSVCSKKIAKKLKLISINELADGDLKMLTCMREVVENNELMFNLLIQTYISVATFHNIVGYIHRDTHYGNFLYQQNTEKGYYHYIFNGTDYYLKACKYNIMIYDYGFAKPISRDDYEEADYVKIKKDIYEDYRKTIHAFFNKKYKGWIKLPNLPDKITNNLMISFSYYLDKNIEYELTHNSQYSCKSYATSLFANIIDNIFFQYAPKDMFITERPPNVINVTPFIIG